MAAPSDLIDFGEAFQIIIDRGLDHQAWAEARVSGEVPLWRSDGQILVSRHDAETWQPKET